MTASVRLPATVSVGMSRRLLTTRIAVVSGTDRDRRRRRTAAPAGRPAGTRSRRPPRARRRRTRTPRRARDSRTATARRCRRAPRRPRAAPRTSSTGPPTTVSHSPTMPGQRDRRARSRPRAGARVTRPAAATRSGPGPVRRVGALAEVGQVVGEVRGDLEQQRDGEAAERRVEPERRTDRERGPEPDDDAAQRRGQRRRPDGEQPDPERRTAARQAGAGTVAGTPVTAAAGTCEKSGRRFSRNAVRALVRLVGRVVQARSRCPRTPGARPARRSRRGTPT